MTNAIQHRATGKKSPKKARALKFANYHDLISENYPPVDYLSEFTVQPMDGNDSFGDCVPVGWANTRALVTKVLTGTEFNATLDQIVALYQTQNPDFDPNGTAQTNGPGSSADAGMDIQTLLEYLVSLGANSPYGELLGFAAVDHTSIDQLKAAISVFGSILIGEAVTDTQQGEFPGEWTWDANGANPGGHCTVGGSHGDSDSECIKQATWADVNWLELAYVENALDEAWVLIWREHVENPTFIAGMDLAKFAEDYKSITGQDFPAPVPDVPPAPTPDPTPAPTPDPTPTPAPTVTLAITSPQEGAVLTSASVGISGTADVDGGVVVYDGSATIGTTSASGGSFSVTVTLADGDHDLWVGMSETDQSAHVAVSVSSQPAPSPTPDPTPQPLPDPTPTPEPAPEPVPDVPEITSPEAGSTLQGPVTVNGTGGSTNVVTLYDGTNVLNVNPIDVVDSGWTFIVDLEPGDHELTAVERNAAGNTSDTSAPVDFTVEAVSPPPPPEDVDAHFAHFLRHRILNPRRRLTWELMADLEIQAQAWLSAKDL